MAALAILRPVFDASDGGDGFVSVEVAPSLAHDTEGTIAAARVLHQRIDRPNVLVKIPATQEGVPAIRQMISEGRSINVTLIFSIDRYDEVIEAYLSGLEALAASGTDDLSHVASVASFFVSRVDTEVDRRIESAAAHRRTTATSSSPLRGQAAVAQARLAYRLFTTALRRTALGGPGRQGGPGPAPAVGVDLDQEPGLSRPGSTWTR